MLGSEHISELTEFLVGFAFKWRLIGTALSFLPQELDAIQAEHASMVDSNKHNLISVISGWVLRTQPHTKPPTVNTLTKALASETVGLGKLASLLESTPVHQNASKVEESLPFLSISVSVTNEGKVEMSHNTAQSLYVSEGTPVLLEVKQYNLMAPCCMLLLT